MESLLPYVFRSLICGLALAASLSAFPVGSPVLVRYDSPFFPYGKVDVTGNATNSINAQSGIFGLEYAQANASNAATTGYSDFQAICVDANQTLFSGTQLYFIESISQYSQILPQTEPPYVDLDATEKTKLGQLFTVGWNDVRNEANATLRAIKSAAFQWAAWNIARDPDMTLSSGPVAITGATYSGATPTNDKARVQNQANAYLSAITSSTAVADLMVWTPVQRIANCVGTGANCYTRIAGQELLVLVPEPAFYGVLALGLAAVLQRARQRKASQTA